MADKLDQTKILTGDEIRTVLEELYRKRRSANSRMNAIIFRLSVCCGLRVGEICGLTVANLKLQAVKPHIYVPKDIAKRRKARKVPLHWDGENLAALRSWKAERVEQGATGDSPFVCCQAKGNKVKRRDRPEIAYHNPSGQTLTVSNAQQRWKRMTKILGERSKDLSIHCGRHSFCSHALADSRSLTDVRDAAGHDDVKTTDIYLHSIEDDTVGNTFTFTKPVQTLTPCCG